jgi:5-methylthioadenosine/S-adenosylhomocysteine deaminase
MIKTTDIHLVSPTWIVPVIPAGVVLENHTLVISENQILALLPTAQALTEYPDAPNLQLQDHIVTPGLINAHGHAAMTLFRGYADDRELMDWLNNHIWPVEGQFVDYDFVYDGTSLVVAEMIRGGTTCAADTYFFPDAVANAFSHNHFRGQVCMPVIQFANAWAKTEDEHIHKGLQFRDDLVKNNPLLTTAFAPHSPYTVTDHGFERTLLYAEELQLPIHLHLHETLTEVKDAVRQHGQRPIARMHSLGLLSPLLQTVHMTQLEAGEITLLANNNVHVAHCPESNLKLASGFCPVGDLIKAGINVAIGTDGAASNNNLDMLEEMRTAAIVAKSVSQDATVVSAHEALALATINGALMLGLEDKIGSLEAGKLADFIAVDLSDLSFAPIYNPVSQMVYAATAHQVSHVWINGVQLLANGQFTQLDSQRVRANTRQWQSKISAFSRPI